MKIISPSCRLEKRFDRVTATIVCDLSTMDTLQYLNGLTQIDNRLAMLNCICDDGELSFIMPYSFRALGRTSNCMTNCKSWISVMKKAEKSFFKMKELGCGMEERLSILPLACATKVECSGSFSKWDIFLRKILSTLKPYYKFYTVFDQFMENFCWTVLKKGDDYEPLREVCVLWKERIDAAEKIE